MEKYLSTQLSFSHTNLTIRTAINKLAVLLKISLKLEINILSNHINNFTEDGLLGFLCPLA